jgi:hypothetical protein
LNLTALQAELAARGFDFLSTARQTQFLNAARRQLDYHALWPYRLTTASGTAPLTIADLQTVKRVQNSTLKYEVTPRTEESLLDEFGDLTFTGSPIFFYVDTSTGANRIVTFPVNSDTIQVRYYKRTTDLSSGSDSPASPSDYHMLIVDMAVQMAYMDSDNYVEAQQLQGWIDAQLADMRGDLLGGMQVAGPGEFQALTGNSVDG